MSSPRCHIPIVLTLLPIVLLAACVPRPAERPGGDFSSLPEKAVFAALREAHASDDQRLKILAAYDEQEPKLHTLDEQAAALLERWHTMDRRDPAFEKNADALAEQWSAVSRDRVRLASAFEARVAAILDKDQWNDWQQFWWRGYGPRRGEGPEEGGEGWGGEGRGRR